MMNIHLIFFVLYILVSTLCEAAYILKVEPNDEECISIIALRNSTIFGDWELLDDDLRSEPVSIVVTNADATERKYRSRRRARSGDFKVEIEGKGITYICVENGIVLNQDEKDSDTKKSKYAADEFPRTVGFDFDVEEINVNKELHDGYRGIFDMASGLTRELGKLRSHHEYMRTREAKHREIVEKTFSKLMIWVLMQCGGVTLLAVAQVMYLRRFLEKKRYM